MAAQPYEIVEKDLALPSVHKHPLRLKASESSLHLCDLCRKSMRAQDYKYKCGDCNFDLCLPCFYAKSNTDPAVDIDGTMKLRAIVANPASRQKLADALEETKGQLGDDVSAGDDVAIDTALAILRNPKVTADQIVKITATLTAKKVRGEVGAAVAESVLAEAGLGSLDPTGILSAINLVRAAARGDVQGVARGAASIILGKILLGALCTIS